MHGVSAALDPAEASSGIVFRRLSAFNEFEVISGKLAAGSERQILSQRHYTKGTKEWRENGAAKFVAYVHPKLYTALKPWILA